MSVQRPYLNSFLAATISHQCRKHLSPAASVHLSAASEPSVTAVAGATVLEKTQAHNIHAAAVTNSQQSFSFFPVRNETTVEVEGLSDESQEVRPRGGGGGIEGWL